MCILIIKKLQIFFSIVILNTIYMMHHFFRLKISSKMLFHNKARPKNITVFMTKRMVRAKNKNPLFTSPSSIRYPTFPITTFLAFEEFPVAFPRTIFTLSMSCHIQRYFELFTTNLTALFNFFILSPVRAIYRAIFSFCRWSNFKCFFTYRANLLNLFKFRFVITSSRTIFSYFCSAWLKVNFFTTQRTNPFNSFNLCPKKTLSRTILASFFYPIWFNIKSLFTNQADNLYHIYLQIKRLFSVCSQETVKSLHLLRAKGLSIKKLFPANDLIVADISMLSI